MFTTIPNELILAFFTMCLGVLTLIWREIKAIRAEFVKIQLEFAALLGQQRGENHEERIQRLERMGAVYHPQFKSD